MSEELTPGQILELRERARAQLDAIPGVRAVGFGVKVVDSELTGQRALRVYVDEKKPLDELPPDQVIPDEIEGIPTDVITIPRGQEFGTQDTSMHSPLIGGITITNMKPIPAGGFEGGTLGCFATMDGVSGPKNVAVLTNNHVLAAGGGAVGDTVYQPNLTGGNVDPLNTGPIGKTLHLGIKGQYNFTYPTESQASYYLDCASAQLNIDISSWCDCNCGVSYKNELREISISGNSKLEGVARAVDNETVFKSGRTTGGTQGTIEDPLGSVLFGSPAVQIDNIIIVRPTNPPDPAFADHGDSGAALVNAQNKLIGLVFGGEEVTEPNPATYACHIAPVMDVLKVTPISTQNPPVGPAGHARSSRPARVGAPAGDRLEDHTLELQDRLRRTTAGAALFAAFLEHRSEIVGLVNRHRPTTIAWHRGKGPTFFAHFAENARHPEHRIPSDIEGVTRRDLADRMEEALMASGSEPLRQAIAENREAVLAILDDFDDLHELVGRFEERPAHV